MKPFLPTELRSRFESLSDSVLPTGDPAGSVHQFRAGYEELIAADCPFCGQYAIDSVNQPLFDPSNYAQEMNEWRVWSRHDLPSQKYYHASLSGGIENLLIVCLNFRSAILTGIIVFIWFLFVNFSLVVYKDNNPR